VNVRDSFKFSQLWDYNPHQFEKIFDSVACSLGQFDTMSTYVEVGVSKGGVLPLTPGYPVLMRGPGKLSVEALLRCLYTLVCEGVLDHTFSSNPLIFTNKDHFKSTASSFFPYIALKPGWWGFVNLFPQKSGSKSELNSIARFMKSYCARFVCFPMDAMRKLLPEDKFVLLDNLTSRIPNITNEFRIMHQTKDSYTVSQIYRDVQRVLFSHSVALETSYIQTMIADGILTDKQLSRRYYSPPSFNEKYLSKIIDQFDYQDNVMGLYLSMKEKDSSLLFPDFILGVQSSEDFSYSAGRVYRSTFVDENLVTTVRYPMTQDQINEINLLLQNGEISLIETNYSGPDHNPTWRVVYLWDEEFYTGLADTIKNARWKALSLITRKREDLISTNENSQPDTDLYLIASDILIKNPDIKPSKFVSKIASICDPAHKLDHRRSVSSGLDYKPSPYFLGVEELYVSSFYLLHPYNSAFTSIKVGPYFLQTGRSSRDFEEDLQNVTPILQCEQIKRTVHDDFNNLADQVEHLFQKMRLLLMTSDSPSVEKVRSQIVDLPVAELSDLSIESFINEECNRDFDSSVYTIDSNDWQERPYTQEEESLISILDGLSLDH
jgi:hypothetical protein